MNRTTIFHNIMCEYNEIILKVQQPPHWKPLFFGYIGHNVQFVTKSNKGAWKGKGGGLGVVIGIFFVN